jgi:hypothetical protein
MLAEPAIVDYRLSTKENKRPSSIFRLQQTNRVCCFHFPFTENKWKLPFSVCGLPEMWGHGLGNMETWRHGDMKKWRWSHRNMET